MCIKALATDIRDGSSAESRRELVIDGRIFNLDGTDDPINLREVVNKVIHGTPTLVVVKDEVVRLHFRNNKDRVWREAWFSGTQLLHALNRELYKHPADQREHEIAQFIERLEERRFPRPSRRTVSALLMNTFWMAARSAEWSSEA